MDWYPWGEAALERARAEDKPIFLSIGYAACHWCHVMAHESFEDSETAAIMNENFVSIKVDREERPDLDGIYMQAAVAMTGSGGWPLSVFLKPDLQPFYAGTYFPPTARFNLPSFRDLLRAIAKAWKEDRPRLERSAESIVEHVRRQSTAGGGQGRWTAAGVQEAAGTLVESYDWKHGGWGSAPKFPAAMALDFLLARAVVQAPRRDDMVALVNHALESMSRGGFLDVVGGGFARYSTDAEWHIPHFEKMLYDNALLGRVYLHAWQVTREPAFHDVASRTCEFLIRELRHPDGGFYSSLDADSPGGEGAYYSWTQDEIRELLAEDSGFFEAAYGVTSKGNWEGKIILQRALDDATLGAKFGVEIDAVRQLLQRCHDRLLAARLQRPPPQADGKVLTAWNGLALATLADMSRSISEPDASARCYEAATRNARFLLTELRPGGHLRRAWRDGRCSAEVFLEDYGALILGLLELYQTDFASEWFSHSVELADEMIARFRSPTGEFFDTPSGSEVVLIRPREIQDNASPSGTALACEALLKLSALTGYSKYSEPGWQLLETTSVVAPRYPLSFGRWLAVADFALSGPKQVALLGRRGVPDFENLLQAIRSEFRPHLVAASSAHPPEVGSPQLLERRPLVGGRATAYVCRDFACELPTNDPETLLSQLGA